MIKTSGVATGKLINHTCFNKTVFAAIKRVAAHET